jgi:glycosyltransferase involved in cell wall biosynthesis
MRVLFVTHNFPRDARDYVGRFVLDLACATAAFGVETTALAPAASGAPCCDSFDAVSVRRFPFGAGLHGDFAYSGELAARASRLPFGPLLFSSMTARAVVLAVHLAPSFDIVHSHWWVPAGIAGHVAASWSGRPHVVTLHGSDVAMLEKLPATRPLAVRVLSKAAAVTLVSSDLKKRLTASLGFEPPRVVVSPMPLSPPDHEPQPPPCAGKLIAVGRLVAGKGIDILLHVVRRLLDDGRDVSLDILGDGPLMQDLRDQAGRLGLADTVTLHGRVPPEQVGPAIEASDVFVLLPRADPATGHREGFGLAFAEALLHGRPVVATRTGGVPEAIGPGGLLVAEDDIAAAASAVSRLLDDQELAARLASDGKRYVVGKVSPEAVGRLFLDVYKEVVASKPDLR